MKKSFLYAIAIFAATSLVSCGGSTNETDIENALNEAVEELEEEIVIFSSEDGNFSINFFGNTPTETSNTVPTELGNLEMVMFMYEKSATEAYMVAYSDYPSEFVNEKSDAYELLEEAKNGALGNIGITATDKEEKIKINGHPGLRFSGNNGQYYVMFDIYLVNNRLYQVAIIRDGSYPKSEVIDTFMKSFKLNPDKEE